MGLALSGNDTLIINNRVIADFADATYAEVTFGSDIAAVKTGKNGNSIFSDNATGRQADMKIRVIRGSPDDKYLNALLAQQKANFAGTVLLGSQFIKKIGDGRGNIGDDKYILDSGIFQKNVGAKSSAEGDTEQSISEYNIKFANCERILA